MSRKKSKLGIQALPLVVFLLLRLWFPAGAAQAKTQLLAGLTYYDFPEALGGKLVFVYGGSASALSSNELSSGLYEFDLATKKLRKLCDSPPGYLHVSNEGEIACIVSGRISGFGKYVAVQAFVYSEGQKTNRLFDCPNTQIWSYL